VTPGFALTSLRFYLMAGAWGAGNGSPGAAKYDNFKLLASTAGSSSVTGPNFGFETPAVGYGNFQYGPSGGSWTFAGGTGVSASGSGFTGGTPSPEESQIAFIQGGNTSTISQSITGFQSGLNYIVICSNTTQQLLQRGRAGLSGLPRYKSAGNVPPGE
jgi:hypothetical protein